MLRLFSVIAPSKIFRSSCINGTREGVARTRPTPGSITENIRSGPQMGISHDAVLFYFNLQRNKNAALDQVHDSFHLVSQLKDISDET